MWTIHFMSWELLYHVALTDRKCENFQEGDKLWVENGCYNDVKNDPETAGF